MAFSGTGHRLGDGDPIVLSDTESAAPVSTSHIGTIPSLKDICLSTLDRYIDLLEDIGTTPYYLIESVLRKCNVKQLTRIELHTEGLSELTDELWYIHATNDFEDLRKEARHYNHSGEWRSRYHAMKQEVEERFERRRALLRQSYSQIDKVKQDRRVIMDPNLRLPKKSTKTTPSWSTAAPKKKSLFEKARTEARKITQMYNTSPYPPPPRTRITGSSSSSTGSQPVTRRIVAPTSVFANNNTPITLGSAASRNDPTLMAHGPSTSNPPSVATLASRTKRYSYKTRPVVYTALSRSLPLQNPDDSTSPTMKRAPVVHNPITPTAPGAIVDFFKEINPAHRSPSSPPELPSKTIQMLREDAATTVRYDYPQGHAYRKPPDGGPQMKKAKVDGDYSWLEDDDDVRDDYQEDKHLKSKDQSRSKDSSKTPVSLEEAGRRFFEKLIGK
ncbi:RNA polymerase II transcription factor SIII subunit A-domain-containing protein [Gamsiella multidivaricata]|uniref:RNA polymerase II transcription factor SIII subunit A-domain-containing protein n=1 Tax=Gamsiella multidivaricata TaxID=101098 RepID=UPI00221F3404|nr:RNA polymerase II transcription factor SIII subunit A-domain-containing protein [Gamsiella multidivaricata]KAI7828931.1 RNA polymerase II transcription factor SIII subunit A-domain-containing protein [Gamsiella multidivaricata]